MNLFLRLVTLFLFPVFVVAQDKNGKEDPIQSALENAREFALEENYEEAVRQFAHCIDLTEKTKNASTTPAYNALLEWHALGEKHPPTLESMVVRRDKATAQFFRIGKDTKSLQEAIPYRIQVFFITLMNRHLEQPEKTVKLFKAIEVKFPNFAQFVDEFCRDALIAQGEYDLILKYLGDPEAKFEEFKKKYLRWEELERKGKAGIFAGSQERDFVYDINQFLKVLYASGATEKADRLREMASAVVDSPHYFFPVQSPANSSKSKP